MNKKLLNKTTTNFLIFSVFILLIAVPAFYYITERLYIEETDETLSLHRDEFLKEELPNIDIKDISLWNKYNRNVQIIPSHIVSKDTIIDKIYFDELENENEPYRELNSPITIKGQPYTYVGRINLIEKEDLIVSIALLFLVVIIILLLGILIITKISSKRLWAPFYDTLNQIQGFEIDKNKKPNFMHTDVEEFNRLNKNLDRLIEKNTDIYNNQREFVENAAHELQTPLALFQTKIDTLFQLDVSKEQSEVLSSLNKDVSRLNRLNKNLLLLSKIENENYFDKQSIVINEYLKKHLDFFTEQAKAKNLNIVIEYTEKLKIEGNPSLTEVLINNLFLNAIRHNIKNGEISIIITGESITFSNTGQEMPLVVDRLFNRFSKANPSSQGNGLGMAIIKKITEISHWKIDYRFENNLHRFTVKF
ncbi:HAMP domain-containing sensor histidine kinase [Flavobacterium branchiarum]|uniref:histidine kinase n=1 Tax=Flavobacterium branchiarum TaxID=1114870 RepID=A0ABV5FPZ5_9FLAO|nr:HAMP domain-containing sensor histidine kinase [Flavobacterium branchiarum]MDN3673139.1 HAMP domain-containing sensor histidine kinase [Flavobacterium branchiarum]